MCNEAKFSHDSLLTLLPSEEKVKHETWFKAKMLSNNGSIADAKKWFLCHGHLTLHENVHVEDGICPDDSISNVGSKHSSQRSHRSGRSSTASSGRIMAEADRAALLARQAALKEKHALEEQQQQLKG